MTKEIVVKDEKSFMHLLHFVDSLLEKKLLEDIKPRGIIINSILDNKEDQWVEYENLNEENIKVILKKK